VAGAAVQPAAERSAGRHHSFLAIILPTVHRQGMSKWLGHSSIPFLTAAVAALVCYRLLESGLGFSGREIFFAAIAGAMALSAALALASLAVRPSRE
jgi:hypothetical protein